MRLSISLNQANGSIFTSSQEVTKLRRTAAVLPPFSLPKKVDRQIAVAAIARERRPVVQRAGNGLARLALGQHAVE
jgi:hypothetical protein